MGRWAQAHSGAEGNLPGGDDRLGNENLPEEERTGFMGGQECGSKSKKAEAPVDTSLFAPASGTRH